MNPVLKQRIEQEGIAVDPEDSVRQQYGMVQPSIKDIFLNAVQSGIPITQIVQRAKEYVYDPETKRILPQSVVYPENRNLNDPSVALSLIAGVASPKAPMPKPYEVKPPPGSFREGWVGNPIGLYNNIGSKLQTSIPVKK